MSNHKLITSEVTISEIYLEDSMMSEQDLTECIKHELALGLAEEILKSNITTLLKNKDHMTGDTKFRVSLRVMDVDDYERLVNAIVREGFNIIRDGEIIPLVTLL